MTTSFQQTPVYQMGQHTKCFLKQMKSEAQSFLHHIHGITSESERSHYAVIMLLRVMVLYFLQQKGVIADNPRYLSSELEHMREHQAENSFYQGLLLPLFHKIAGNQPYATLEAPDAYAAKIPSYTLHLFAEQQVEREHTAIEITNEAFIQLFTVFDSYNWQLIEEGEVESNTLYPAVLSDFFEQQINQKQTGAYYTRKDVTAYICENSIVRHLLEEAGAQYPAMFGYGGAVWQLLRKNPDRYISDALRNAEALPLETQREYEIRRTRYEQLRELLLNGGVECCADMLTHNLDMMQFALDCIEYCQQEEVLLTFYENLQRITVLDPTCGTGALLIEALNMLKILYRACLQKMQVVQNTGESRIHQSHIHNSSILRSILSNNLYGVELAEAAAHICTARLLLTALGYCTTLEERQMLLGLECNVRHGNALVGRVRSSEETTEELVEDCIDKDYKKLSIEKDGFHWDLEYSEAMQQGGFDVIIGNPPYIEYSKIREHYQAPGYQVGSCGNLYAAVIERAMHLCKPGKSQLGLIVPLSICGGERFTQLRATMSKRLGELWLANFEIFPGRLFEGAFQRLTILLATHDDQQACVTHVTKIQRWYTPERPQLIELMHYTAMHGSLLPGVFPKLASRRHEDVLSKVQQRAEEQRLGAMLQSERSEAFVYYQEATNYWLKAVCKVPYYKKNGVVMEPPHGRFLYFENETTARIIMAIMNSSLFYTWFATFSDGFHLAHALVRDFPLARDLSPLLQLAAYAQQLEMSITKYARRSTRNTRPNRDVQQSTHFIELEEYRMRYCKPLLDGIDALLADYYEFTNEELAFVINYDIKYRMGPARLKKN